MSLKSIKLSSKKGGTGYVSSYTVSIGRREALSCGFLSDDKDEEALLCKIVNPQTQEIIIKKKKCTLTWKIINDVIKLSKKLEDSGENTSKERGSIYGLLEISQIKGPSEEEEEAEKQLKTLLYSYSEEILSDLLTLLLIGLDDDADMTLESYERFLDYWNWLSEGSTFTGDMASYLIEKRELHQWIQKGVEVLSKPAEEERGESDPYEE